MLVSILANHNFEEKNYENTQFRKSKSNNWYISTKFWIVNFFGKIFLNPKKNLNAQFFSFLHRFLLKQKLVRFFHCINVVVAVIGWVNIFVVYSTCCYKWRSCRVMCKIFPPFLCTQNSLKYFVGNPKHPLVCCQECKTLWSTLCKIVMKRWEFFILGKKFVIPSWIVNATKIAFSRGSFWIYFCKWRKIRVPES